jgi:parallel beta-helix repeat protein
MLTRSHLVRTTIAILGALASLAASAVTSNPTPQRAYVSLSGSDANNCGPTAPCRTFQAALAQVNPDGEVLVLDSGAYGTMTITQGVTVTAPPGVYAGISVFGGDGVSINAPGSKVVLRGLTINGQGGGNGVNFVDGAMLTIEDCLVANMSLNGIQVVATTAPKVFIGNTKVRANGQSGIYLEGAMTAILDGVRAEANLYGVYARSGPSVTIRNSTAAANIWHGFNVDAATAATTMLVSNSALLNQGLFGLYLSGATATLIADKNEISGNDIGVYIWFGTYGSLGNNVFLNNRVDVNGATTSDAAAIK